MVEEEVVQLLQNEQFAEGSPLIGVSIGKPFIELTWPASTFEEAAKEVTQLVQECIDIRVLKVTMWEQQQNQRAS